MRITNVRCFALAAGFLVALLFLPCRGEAGDGETGQDGDARARFLSAAAKAIRSHRGGVFVVKIEGSCLLPHSFTFWHIFTTEEVVKPYRNDEGAYFIPLMINERTGADRRPKLLIGRRYLLVTRLKWAAYSPLYVEEALDLEAEGHAQLLEEIRADARKDGVYGSSRYLRSELGATSAVLETSGVQTPHADGFVDPEPFGFTREGVLGAVTDGTRVLLVRPLEGEASTRGDDHLVEVVEDLAKAGGAKETLWVRDPRTHDEKVARSAKMPVPYRLAKWCPHRRYVILADPRAKGPPVVKEMLPEIHDNGPTVRRVRSWLEKPAMVRLRLELDGKPYAAKGLRVTLGAKEVVCSDDGATFEDVEPGKHRLAVDRIEGYAPIAAREIEAGSGKTADVVIALEREGG